MGYCAAVQPEGRTELEDDLVEFVLLDRELEDASHTATLSRWGWAPSDVEYLGDDHAIVLS